MRVGKLWLALGLVVGCMACDKDTPKKATPEKAVPSPTKAGIEKAPKDRAQKQREPETLLDFPVERRLYAGWVEASSFLLIDFNRFQENYHPNYLLDGDPRTAWTEGAENLGVGEWVRIRTSPVTQASNLRLRIQNGYHKTPRLFKRNGRVKEFELKSLASGKTQRFTLEDGMEWQEVSWPLEAETFEGFELKVVSDYPGTKYHDLCISDMEVYVTGRTKENPKFEADKLKRLLAWKKGRLDAAALFASEEARKALHVKSAYQVTRTRVDPKESALDQLKGLIPGDAPVFARAEEALRSDFAGWKHYEMTIENPVVIPQVDGIQSRDEGEVSLQLKDRFTLPAIGGESLVRSKSITLEEAEEPDDMYRHECTIGDVYVLAPPKSAGRAPQELKVWWCIEELARDAPQYFLNEALLEYDDEGWLRLILEEGHVALHLDWQTDGAGVLLAGGHRTRNLSKVVDVLSAPGDTAP